MFHSQNRLNQLLTCCYTLLKIFWLKAEVCKLFQQSATTVKSHHANNLYWHHTECTVKNIFFNILQHWIQAASPKTWRDSLSLDVGDKARTINKLVLSWYHQYEKFLFLVVDMEKKKGGGKVRRIGEREGNRWRIFPYFYKRWVRNVCFIWRLTSK